MTDFIMSDEEVHAYAALLEEGTLDNIRRGVPVSSEQAIAAKAIASMAYRSLYPEPKPTSGNGSNDS